jgi:hypothetical protein
MAESERGRSKEIARRLADMRPHAARAEYARARSAATIMAASRAAMRLADEPVLEPLAVAEGFMAAVADTEAAVANVNRDDRVKPRTQASKYDQRTLDRLID